VPGPTKRGKLNPHTPLVATQQPAGIESAGWLIVHTPDKSAPQLKEQTSRPNKGVYCVALPTQWNCMLVGYILTDMRPLGAGRMLVLSQYRVGCVCACLGGCVAS